MDSINKEHPGEDTYNWQQSQLKLDIDRLSAKVSSIEQKLEPFADTDRQISKLTLELTSGLVSRARNGIDAVIRTVLQGEQLSSKQEESKK